MSAAEKIRLEGKDWFTEDEAAAYCGVALSTFRFCGRCGLINLRNRETQKAINRVCPGRETEDGS